ncbi:MAG: hypothetical protein ACUVUE_03770 [Candidatus Bathycorpusculaceae bacterium]
MLDLTESVTIPKGILKELCAWLVKVEEALATIEELMDKESLERICKAEDEY